MKRKIIFSISVLAFTLSSFVMYKDPNATKILDKASAKFKLLNSFSAEYKLLIENTQTKMKESYSGSVLVSGKKFKIVTADQEIYCDGITVWTYMMEDNEVTITEYDEEDEMMNVDKIVNMYKTGYKYVMLPEESVEGVACHVIDFEPDITQRKEKPIKYIRLE